MNSTATLFALISSGVAIGPALYQALPGWAALVDALQPLATAAFKLGQVLPIDAIIELLFS